MKTHDFSTLPLTVSERKALSDTQKLLGEAPDWYWERKSAEEEAKEPRQEGEARFALLLETLYSGMEAHGIDALPSRLVRDGVGTRAD